MSWINTSIFLMKKERTKQKTFLTQQYLHRALNYYSMKTDTRHSDYPFHEEYQSFNTRTCVTNCGG